MADSPERALADFEREWDVRELLSAADCRVVRAALEGSVGGPVRLLDAKGRAIFGESFTASTCVPVKGELEAIAFLETAAPQLPTAAAARMLELLLRAQARYRMASALHVSAVNEDYRLLQERHAQLQQSEQRYRALADELEHRVAEQVGVIEAAQRKLYQAEKLASVGQLAAGVAHEINNPIGFVKSNLNVAAHYHAKWSAYAHTLHEGADAATLRDAWRALELDDVVEDLGTLIQESLDGVGRVARIVADLKSFARIDNAPRENVDINDVVRSVCNVTMAQIKERARITLDLAPVPKLACDGAALGQALSNMLINAAQAMDGEGEIRISTQAGEDSILVTVSDIGRGITPDILPRIFDPFFTTRDVGAGVGLGLTVSADVVRAHGGDIDVQSTPGAGTTFVVRLPRTPEHR